jgi:CDGSH-type Zn-finger protein
MAPADQVAEVVRRCPSGALLYRRLDGGPEEEPDGLTTVTPMRDGPLLVTGRIDVRHEDGTVETLPRATLCRCGESQHKPFCDNQHLSVGFRAPGRAFQIHLSPVRSQLDKPMSKAEDPRRLS